jgi:hypothetical protein
MIRHGKLSYGGKETLEGCLGVEGLKKNLGIL